MIIIMFRGDAILYLCVVVLSYFFSLSLYKHSRFEVFKWIFMVGVIGVSEYNNRFKGVSLRMT